MQCNFSFLFLLNFQSCHIYFLLNHYGGWSINGEKISNLKKFNIKAAT